MLSLRTSAVEVGIHGICLMLLLLLKKNKSAYPNSMKFWANFFFLGGRCPSLEIVWPLIYIGKSYTNFSPWLPPPSWREQMKRISSALLWSKLTKISQKILKWCFYCSGVCLSALVFPPSEYIWHSISSPKWPRQVSKPLAMPSKMDVLAAPALKRTRSLTKLSEASQSKRAAVTDENLLLSAVEQPLPEQKAPSVSSLTMHLSHTVRWEPEQKHLRNIVSCSTAC